METSPSRYRVQRPQGKSVFRTVLLCLGLFCGMLSNSTAVFAQEISTESTEEAEAFFRDNGVLDAKPLTHQSLATFIEARKLYLAKDYQTCLKTLNALWKQHPIGSEDWHQSNMPLTNVNLGGPHAYTGLLMLTDACKWHLNPESTSLTPTKMVMGVVIFGHSRGHYPHNKAELLSGRSPIVIHDIQPEILANNHQLVRDSLWLFGEYLLALSQGHLQLELEFIDLPDVTIPVLMENGPAPIAAPPPTYWQQIWQDLLQYTKKEPEWWWTIYPSNVPDEYPDFARSEFITGGSGLAPITKGLRLEIDDKWLTRLPPHLGKGKMTPLEIQTYLPMWLQHEFFHHVHGRYPELGLEKKAHQWHHKADWPRDFVGIFEPDYFYQEAHKRLMTDKVEPIWVRLRYNRPSVEVMHRVDMSRLLGVYAMPQTEDPWGTGQITFAGRDDNGTPVFRWTNKANVSWLLHPQNDSLELKAGNGNPYTNDPNGKVFAVQLKRDNNGKFIPEIRAFTFMNGTYIKMR